jgi:hypothetical protein
MKSKEMAASANVKICRMITAKNYGYYLIRQFWKYRFVLKHGREAATAF